MGSEIFKLKSIDLEPTVVRGARTGFKNEKTTAPLQVNYSPEVTHSGEHGVRREYLVQSSLTYNDFKGDATFTNGSDIVSGYTAPYDAAYNDIIRRDGDTMFYTVTGMDGSNVYITQKYAKANQTDPDIQTGVCTVRRVDLGSVNYETFEGAETGVPFYFDKDRTEWHPTGAEAMGPYVAYSGLIDFSTGIDIKFGKATKTSAADLSTIGSVKKTLVDNNSQDLVDVSLSPMPYPHSSLKVWWSVGSSGLEEKSEFKDYVVNYSQSPDFAFPYPPYEERNVAYIKFLDELVDEVQVTGIGPTTAGIVAVSKEVTVQSSGSKSRKPVQRIIYGTDSVKVGNESVDRYRGYVLEYDAGTLVFVDHQNREQPYDHVAVPRDIMWNGVSVIRGVPEDEVRNKDDLVIPGITGLLDVPGVMYFEDADQNAMASGADYVIEYTSGAFRLTNPLKKGQAVLVSYYVEGEDVETEKLLPTVSRLRKYPVLNGSVSILKRWSRTDQYGRVESGSTVLVEGSDYEMSYFTGYVRFLNSSMYTEEVTSLDVTYTPMSQINCILQSKENDRENYRMTVVDDALETVEGKEFLFKVNNPVVSVPVEDYFKQPGDPSKFSFSGTVLADAPVYARVLGSEEALDTSGWVYDDQSRNLSLDKSVNDYTLQKDDSVVATYSFEGDVLPYAPVQIVYPFIAANTRRFLIEGFDRTDIIKAGTVLRIDNRDPVAIYYFIVQDATYTDAGTYVTVRGTFTEDINAPQFYVLDAPVVWTDMPLEAVLDTDVLKDSDTLTFSGGTLEMQEGVKPNTLLLVDNTDVYNVTSVTVSGTDTVVGISPPLVSPYPKAIVRSRTPVYSVGGASLSMKHFVLGGVVQEPAFTVSYVPPEGFEGSARVYVDSEYVVLFESISGVPNPVPYMYRKLDYPSVDSLAYAIQATPSNYNESVKFGPRVPPYNPFTVSPPDSPERQYYLDAGTYSPDLITPFDQETVGRLPYTFTIAPELLRWSLLRSYKGQSSVSVKNADLTGRYAFGDVMAFAYGGGQTGVQYMGVTGVSVETVDEVSTSKVHFQDSFRANIFDPALYVKRGVSWVSVPNRPVSVEEDGTSLTLSGGFQSQLKPGTLLRFKETYIHAVEKVTHDIAGDTIMLQVYPPIVDGYADVYSPGYRLEQTAIPMCLSQVPDQPYIDLSYTPPDKRTGYGVVSVMANRVVLTETVDNYLFHTTELSFEYFSNLIELCAAIDDVDSLIAGHKPFRTTIRDEYRVLFESDSFQKYLLERRSDVFMPCAIKVAVASASVEYDAPFGYTGVGYFFANDSQISVGERVMPVIGGNVEERNHVYNYADYLSFYRILDAVASTPSAVPGSTPFSVDSLQSQSFLGAGMWDHTHTSDVYGSRVAMPAYYHATTDFEGWEAQAPLNIRRLVLGEDYSIDAGIVNIEEPIEDLDRFAMSYLGRDVRAEDEGEPITISCKYFSTLPAGSRLDVYMDFKAIDQFYIQKLTERNFMDLVVVPQLEDFLEQIGTGNGQGADTAPANDTVQNWQGGVSNIYYLLQDEEIKKTLYLKFYHWYKQRLRNFASELQITNGFKFANSNAIGEVDGRLTLQDEYVEDDGYTLTRDEEIDVVPVAYSKFFPIGYGSQPPKYYPRFGASYRLYNDVYCFNIRYKYSNGDVKTVGYIKSVRPYWTHDLDHVILKNTNDNLVAYYEVPIPTDERTYSATDEKYSWLKRVSVGDSINIFNRKKLHKVTDITSGYDSQTGKTYELIKLDSKFTSKSIRTFRLRQQDGVFYYWVLKPLPIPPFVVPVDKKPEAEFLASLSGEGRNVVLTRDEAESFPMFDDEGSYGYKLLAGEIEGYDKNDRRKNRIRKFSLADFLSAMFGIPMPDVKEQVRVQVGTYNEDTLEFTPTASMTVVEIERLSRIERRKVSSTQEGLYINRLDETDDFVGSPGIKEFAYLDFETIYTPEDEDGYIESFVLRAKDRDQWLRFYVGYDENGDAVTTDIAEEYGFPANQLYKGFYDPDNIYRWLLMEKQAWQTEESVLKDLYDYNDKLARAFKQGDLRLDNVSPYKGYLANYIAGEPAGISDWLAARLPKYERALYFLIGGYSGYGDQGSPLGIMRPDGVHDENEASPEIAQSYSQATAALVRYQSFYNALQEYKYINSVNNTTWKGDYVRWVLGLVEGLMHQKTAREMYDSSRKIEVGLVESQAISLDIIPGRYTVTAGAYAVSGDTMYLYAELVDTQNPVILVPPYSRAFSLKNATGDAYITIGELASYISSGTYFGEKLFNLIPVYKHYPYADETCRFLVRGTWTLSLDATSYLSSTNVEDHRASDPRILFLDRMVEDKLSTDNQTDPGNPYKVWPMYSANGNVAKRAIEGIPVAGNWEIPSADFYQVMKITCLDSPWSVTFDDLDDFGDGVIDYKAYMGPQDIIERIDLGCTITEAEYDRLSTEVVVDPPRVSILKAINLVRRGVEEKTLTFDLRKYPTVAQLVDAINSARFNQNLEQDVNGTLKLFEAELIGGEEHGRFKTYGLEVEFVPINKDFEYYKKLPDDSYTTISKVNYHVGWKIVDRSANKFSYLTFSVRPQKYSMDPTAAFFMDGPDVAYQSTLTKFPLGLRKDIRAFDLYCWDELDADGKREYEVRDNVMYFRSANVPNVAVPLAGSGDEFAPERESLKQLVDRINNNPLLNKWFFANLQFTRDDVHDPGYFEYGYLPNFTKSVPKSTLQDFVLRKDVALRLTSTEDAEYRIESDGFYNPLDTETVFRSLRLWVRSNVRSLAVGKGAEYSFSSSSMVIDDGADTLDLSASYTYVYQYSQTFQFSNASYDTTGELVTAINASTIPGVGGALFTATLDSNVASTRLLQASGTVAVSPSVTQLSEKDPVFPYTVSNALKLSVAANAGIYTISNARYSVPASRSQLTISCTITYVDTYTPATINISSGNYTIGTLSNYISTLKPFSVFPSIFTASVYNDQYDDTDASLLLDATTSVSDVGYGSVQALMSYDFSGRNLGGIAYDVTTDMALTGVTATVIGDYSSAEASLLVPVPAYTDIGSAANLEADFRGLIGLRMLNMFSPSFATFYIDKVEIVADGNYTELLPSTSKDLHGWIDSVRGDLVSGMLGVQVLPIKVDAVPYGLPLEQSQALTYNEPTHVYFGVMGDIKFVQISDHSLHVQLNNVKRRLGKPWTINGTVEDDHYTPETYSETSNYNAIDMAHFLGWLRNTRYLQIKDSVVKEALVSNKHLWLFMKFHREVGCDQKAYQYRKRIEATKESRRGLLSV